MTRITLLTWAFTYAVLALPSLLTGQSPVEYFLEIPDIAGEAQREGYEGQICVTSFSYDISREVPRSGRTILPPSWDPFRFGKNFDIASPYLFGAAAQGRRISEMTFSVLVPDQDGLQLRRARYRFKDVTISGYETGGDETGTLREVISIRAEEIEITHYSDSGQAQTFEYNFISNIGG